MMGLPLFRNGIRYAQDYRTQHRITRIATNLKSMEFV